MPTARAPYGSEPEVTLSLLGCLCASPGNATLPYYVLLVLD